MLARHYKALESTRFTGWGNAVNKFKIVAVGVSGLALALASPNAAGAAAVDGQSGTVSAAAAVASFYDTYRSQQIWFRNGPNVAAIAQLTAILQRAPFDGLAEGPELAAQVQAAAAQANSGKPEDIANAERVLSEAWLQYAQTVKKPTTGMIYAYPVLEPQGERADEILLTAAAAPSLAAYLTSTSDVNAIYKQLRDTAWAQAQASGPWFGVPTLK